MRVGGPQRGESANRGSVTVEFTMLLPTVVLLLALVLGSGVWAMARMNAQGAANAAARVAMVESDSQARATAREIAGSDAKVSIAHSGQWILVTVTVDSVWGLPVSAEAVAREQ